MLFQLTSGQGLARDSAVGKEEELLRWWTGQDSGPWMWAWRRCRTLKSLWHFSLEQPHQIRVTTYLEHCQPGKPWCPGPVTLAWSTNVADGSFQPFQRADWYSVAQSPHHNHIFYHKLFSMVQSPRYIKVPGRFQGLRGYLTRDGWGPVFSLSNVQGVNNSSLMHYLLLHLYPAAYLKGLRKKVTT